MSKTMRLITGGVALAALLAALTLALWPMSEAEQARQDGEHLGQAVAELRDAESTDDVDSALDDLHSAIQDTREHAGDAVYDQVDDQGNAIYHAVNGYIGTVDSADDWESDLYEEELETALDDLYTQAEEFRTSGPEVVQSYWDGVQDGLES